MDSFFRSFVFPNYNYFSGPIFGVLLLPLILWSLVWKGLGLWFAAKNAQKYWFIAILILNTLGILEIAYLFYFAKKRLKLDLLFKKSKI